MIVKCSNCGHVFRRRDLMPGDLVRCNAGRTVPVVPASTHEGGRG